MHKVKPANHNALNQKTVIFLKGETKILGKETQEEKTIRHRCIKFRCQGGETFVSFLRIHFETLVLVL